MLEVYSGEKFKKWFLEEGHRIAVMPVNGCLHILNFSEIDNKKYYLIESASCRQVFIKEVEIID